MSQNVPKLKSTARRKKVIELRAKGRNIADIAAELHVNEKTVDRDLKSTDVKAFVDELQRRQIMDIESEAKGSTRMHFRDRLLDKLMPKKIEARTEAKTEVKVEIPDIDAEKLLGDIASAIADNYMDSEAKKLREDHVDSSYGADEDSEGGLDPEEASPRDG